jgi:D-aminopeptidase
VVPGPDREAKGGGSIIVILATDAPLLPHQCRRLAQRATIGVARTGGGGEHDSGDIFLAFATGNRNLRAEGQADAVTRDIRMLDDDHITALFWGAIEATEEAIVNALLAAETMSGNGVTFHALPADRLLEILRQFGRGPAAG